MTKITKYVIRFEKWIEKFGLDKKEHQMKGMKWCLNNELCEEPIYGIKGGIIADEMGLGKTILMIGCIISNLKKHTLIVLPPALLDQWVLIIEKLLGHHPLVFHGGNAKKVNVDDILNSKIVVTTYGMISERKDFDSKLWKIQWNRVIYDEAHHLRNRKTTNYLGAQKIKSEIKWMVTGTPIQNKISDFISLCNLVGLGKAVLGCIKGKKIVKKELKKLLNAHFLHRTKKSVGIKLPPVEETYINVEWKTIGEKRLAEEVHDYCSFSDIRLDNVQRIISQLTKNSCVAILRAKQVCILPELLEDAVYKLKRKNPILMDMNLMEVSSSSKIDKIVETIEKSNKKKLVFCHFRAEIDKIAEKLAQKKMSIITVDGRTKHKEKSYSTIKPPTLTEWNLVCKKWNKNNYVYDFIKEFMIPDVMILQIQTGCEGLNLQQFQEVYFTSPHWNPSVEAQAIARCHRIGQTKPVKVFKFMMKGFGEALSLDQYCRTIQEKKRKLVQILNK